MRLIVIDSSSSGAGDNCVALALLSVLRYVSRFPLQARPFIIWSCLKSDNVESCRNRGWKVQSYKVGPGMTIAMSRNKVRGFQ